jgi:hypothetical protein
MSAFLFEVGCVRLGKRVVPPNALRVESRAPISAAAFEARSIGDRQTIDL